MSPALTRLVAMCFLAALSGTCEARPLATGQGVETGSGTSAESALPYIQCVPYARQVSGIRLYGDAHTWWRQAAGRYARGTRPRVGAVMALRPHGAMVLGHVAAVSRIIDARTVLLRHANWSLIGGRRGQLEDNVRAVDVSPSNDWSEVRVWFAPLGNLGTTRWPVEGFIYNQRPSASERLTVLASAEASQGRTSAYVSRIGPDFLKGIVPEAGPTTTASRRQPGAQGHAAVLTVAQKQDPIGRIIASRLH